MIKKFEGRPDSSGSRTELVGFPGGDQTARRRAARCPSSRASHSHTARARGKKTSLEGQVLLLNPEERVRLRTEVGAAGPDAGPRDPSTQKVLRVLAGHRTPGVPVPPSRCFCPSRRFVTYVRDSWWTAPATCICSRTNLVGAAEERKGPGRGRINTCAMCTHASDCVSHGA